LNSLSGYAKQAVVLRLLSNDSQNPQGGWGIHAQGSSSIVGSSRLQTTSSGEYLNWKELSGLVKV
jgi:hypothetical protein